LTGTGANLFRPQGIIILLYGDRKQAFPVVTNPCKSAKPSVAPASRFASQNGGGVICDGLQTLFSKLVKIKIRRRSIFKNRSVWRVNMPASVKRSGKTITNQQFVNPCYLPGSLMKAKGLCGQGERVSQMLVSRIPLAEESKPSTRSKATSPLRKYSVICVETFSVFSVAKKVNIGNLPSPTPTHRNEGQVGASIVFSVIMRVFSQKPGASCVFSVQMRGKYRFSLNNRYLCVLL